MEKIQNFLLMVAAFEGSGMIAPNMATMLSFIVTDANVSKFELKKI